MKKIVIIILAVMPVLLSGCYESYSSPGTHVNHHYKPSTSDTYQALGEMAYQMRGKRKGVTPRQYNEGMKSLGAMGTLMDYMGP